jgi:hypothetical protein
MRVNIILLITLRLEKYSLQHKKYYVQGTLFSQHNIYKYSLTFSDGMTYNELGDVMIS